MSQLTFNSIYIIDFEDSFTYNIASVLYTHKKDLVVCSHKEFFKNKLSFLINSSKACAVILGPGPGHPDQYNKYYYLINQMINCSHIYLMGICLGHQIIGSVLGYDILPVKNKLHGRAKFVELKGKNHLVQFYNSLGVFESSIERPVLVYPRGISYQFHPESIGTATPAYFFKDMLLFLNQSARTS